MGRADVVVDPPFGQQAEFVGAALLDHFGGRIATAQGLDVGVGFGRVVRAGDGDHGVRAFFGDERQTPCPQFDFVEGVGGVGAGFDPVADVGAESPVGKVDFTQVRNVNHCCCADVVLHQGDVDREFVVAVDEFARAVERIDQPEKFPVATLLIVHFASVLAQNRDAGLAQRAFDDVVRRTVGGGDGTGIPVVFRKVVVVAVFVNLHYGGSGPYCGVERIG